MAAPIMEFYSDRCMPLYLDAYGGRLNRRVSFYGVGAELRDEGPHSFHIVLPGCIRSRIRSSSGWTL